MKKLFQIVFFVLYPLLIYSKETLHNENDSTLKQLVADTNHIENRGNKNDSTRKPRNLGVGVAYGLGEDRTIIDKNLAFLQTTNQQYSFFPFLLFTKKTPKSHFHSIGVGFKITNAGSFSESSYTTEKRREKYYLIYYQYDFPLLKAKSSTALLYTGFNFSASMQATESGYYSGHGMSPDMTTLTVNSTENIVSLNLPIGYKKQFGSSWVWFDYGINLNLISYRHIKYDYEREYKDYAEADLSHSFPPIITYTYEKDKKDKFYQVPFSPYPVNSIYLKFIFIPKRKTTAINKTNASVNLDSLSTLGLADTLNRSDSNKVELKRHTLFLELGGTAILYSIKYDLILKQWNKFSINYSIGFSFYPIGEVTPNIFLPIQLSGIYGKNNSKLEFGVFILPFASIPSKNEKLYENKTTDYGSHKGINIGYRYQKKQGGLFFKTYFLATYYELGYFRGNSFISYFIPWIGIGIGHTLNK